MFDFDLPPYSPKELLTWMSTDLPNFYLLGSLNRHITVHSQQCRAINLIHALAQSGIDEKSIAIIGAGFAGLTAAAFALEKTTASVSLFDVAPRPLWIQDSCGNRWLHPGIYDWPRAGSLEPCTNLPVLNWRAGKAADVSSQVRAEWERIASRKAKLSPRFQTRVVSVEMAAKDKLKVQLSDGQSEDFDIVVSAVGFGLEPGAHGRIGYWNDADGLEDVDEESSVLVGGFGDGGLADVLRLCMPDISQANLIELVRDVPVDDQKKMLAWEDQHRGNIAALDTVYQELKVEPIIEVIKRSQPPLTHVTLAGPGYLYGSRSAVLNRFLVSQLRQARGEHAFELVKGPVDQSSFTRLPEGARGIKLGHDAREQTFSHILLRLGPIPVYKNISPLAKWSVGDERRRHWLELPQSLDRTRVPLWEDRGTHSLWDGRRSDFLAYESSSRAWCLVLSPSSATLNWKVYAGLALENVDDWKVQARFSADNAAKELNPVPLFLCSDEAFIDQTALSSTVRALCAADIVIADVTGYDSGLLLLLGIRAAVRRSVTIACTKDRHSRRFWEQLPFNLKELNLVSFYDEEEGLKELTAALRAGLAQSDASPHYLDLPVYDYVREDLADSGTADPSRVLFLRAFDSGRGRDKIVYGADRKVFVDAGIHAALRLPKNVPIETVIDQTSPRLAGQRLYEAIRHWQTCIVDLTWWRPNVLFELGVRLAVRPNRTFCIVDSSLHPDADDKGTKAQLQKLLNVCAYDLRAFPKTLQDQVPDHVYVTAARHFRTSQDRVGETVDTMLLAAAAITPGHDDPQQAVDVTPLYARDNPQHGLELRHSVFEKLCAAWCYLSDRTESSSAQPIDLLDPLRIRTFRQFRRLGSRLKTALAQRHSPYDQSLKQRIEDSNKLITESGAAEMADLLDSWVSLRQERPWKVQVASMGERERQEFMEDCKHYVEHLQTLEGQLTKFDNPACDLPLQGIRSDVNRLEIVRRRLVGESHD